jgi:hypothetical protein
MSESFAGAARDPEAMALMRRRALAQSLMQGATQSTPMRTAAGPWSALAQALAGGVADVVTEGRERDLYDTRRTEAQEYMAQVPGFGGLTPGQGSAPRPPTVPGAPMAPATPMAPRAASGGAVTPAVAPADLAPLIEEVARETGIPAALLTAQIRQESNFDPRARGRAGEIGLGQIMPATARQPGFGVQPVDPAALDDPRTNIRFQAQYLRGRGQAAGVTDWNDPAQQDRALAAYNGGGDPNYVQNVRRWLPNGAPAGADPNVIQASAPAPAGQQPAPAGQPPAAAAGLNREAMVMHALRGMQSTNPEIRRQAQMLMQAAQALPQTPQRQFATAAPGSAILDPRTGQVIGQVPEAPDRTLETVEGPDGRPVLVPRSQAAGRVPVRTPAVTVNNNNSPEGALPRELGQRGAARIDTMLPQAQQAAEAVQTGQRVLGLLQSGVITGTGAGFREALERGLVTAGLVDGQRVANTGQLMSELANATLAAAGGLSGPTSDRDILFLREVAGGNLALTEPTIRRIVQVSIDRSTRTLGNYNRVAEGLQNDPAIPENTRRLYAPIPVPTMDARPANQPAQAAPAAQAIQGGQVVADPPPPAIPAAPRTVPAGSAYSPSRRMWRSPDGRMFSEDGRPAQ